MAEKLKELDTSAVTTPIKNWLGRQGNALLHGFTGGGRSLGRHGTRLVANKLYREWQAYLGSQGLQPTQANLEQYIGQSYGPNVRDQIFPSAAAPAAPTQAAPAATQTTPPSTPSPAATPIAQPTAQPTATPTTSAGTTTSPTLSNTTVQRPATAPATAQPARPTQPSSLSNVSVTPRAAPSAQPTPPPTASQPTGGLNPRLRDSFARHQAGIDAERQRQAGAAPASAQPTPAVRSQLPKASRNPNTFTQADYDKLPPHIKAQFDKQMGATESQRGNGRLVEAPPDDLTIPRPPAGTPTYRYGPKTRPFVRDTRPPPDMSRPPEFLRRQRNQPAPAPAPARPTAAQPASANTVQPPNPTMRPTVSSAKLSRAQQDQVMVALARVLLAKGGASIDYSKQKNPQQSQRTQPRLTGGSQTKRGPINIPMLQQYMTSMRIDPTTQTNVEQILAQDRYTSLDNLVKKLRAKGPVDAGLIYALDQATQ
jgi:hypothetical protein